TFSLSRAVEWHEGGADPNSDAAAAAGPGKETASARDATASAARGGLSTIARFSGARGCRSSAGHGSGSSDLLRRSRGAAGAPLNGGGCRREHDRHCVGIISSDLLSVGRAP